MLTAHDVSFIVDGRRLLDSVSMTVEPGELVTVLGANGAGKSTLLRVLAGEITPSSGEVRMNDRPLARWTPIEQARARAVLPQDSRLTFSFTVLEVVLLGRTPHAPVKEGRGDIDAARSALAAAGVLHLEGRLYPTLSGGERQRVDLARVLAQLWNDAHDTPRYLLLDEPTSSLDLAHQHNVLRVARSFAARGVGVLAVLHDLNLAAQYADRLLMMKRGRVSCHGTPEDVLTPENIGSTFDVSVVVLPHPTLGCPLVVTTPSVDHVDQLEGSSIDLTGSSYDA